MPHHLEPVPTPEEILEDLNRQIGERRQLITERVQKHLDAGKTEAEALIMEFAAISVQCDHAVGMIIEHREEHKPRPLIEIPGRR